MSVVRGSKRTPVRRTPKRIAESDSESGSASDEEDFDEDEAVRSMSKAVLEKLKSRLDTAVASGASSSVQNKSAVGGGASASSSLDGNTLNGKHALRKSLLARSASWFRPKKSGVVQMENFDDEVRTAQNTMDVLDGGALVDRPLSDRRKKVLERKENPKPETAGGNWYDLPATPMTPEIRNDLRVIAMRQHLDPKRFYKKDNKRKKLPKFFQVGTVVESSAEFYSSRIPRKERSEHFVQAILDDSEKRQYLKRKFVEVQQSKARSTSKRFSKKKGKKK